MPEFVSIKKAVIVANESTQFTVMHHKTGLDNTSHSIALCMIAGLFVMHGTGNLEVNQITVIGLGVFVLSVTSFIAKYNT